MLASEGESVHARASALCMYAYAHTCVRAFDDGAFDDGAFDDGVI